MVENLKEQLEKLSNEDTKRFLFLILSLIDQIDQNEISMKEGISTIKNILNGLNNIGTGSQYLAYHITFDESTAGSLRYMLSKEGVQTEKVIGFWNHFTEGPIEKLHETIGFLDRVRWIKEHIERDEYDEYQLKYLNTLEAIDRIPKEIPIVIWISDNAHEQLGLRFVLYLIQNRNRFIKEVNIQRMFLQSHKDHDITYKFRGSGEFSPEYLRTIYSKLVDVPTITLFQKELYEEEWLKWSKSKSNLRLWLQEKITAVDETYFDKKILTYARKLQNKNGKEKYIKSARIVGEVLGHIEDQYITDSFIEYRLRKLIEQGYFEVEGDLSAMRYYSVRMESQQDHKG